MARQLVSLAVIAVLMLPGASALGSDRQATKPAPAAVRERVLAIPSGTLVEVRQNGQQRKLRGRINSVSEEGFVLTVVSGNEEMERKLAFREVKSVEKVAGGTSVKAAVHGLYRGLATLGYLLAKAFVYAEP